MARYFDDYPIVKDFLIIHNSSNMKDPTGFRFAKAGVSCGKQSLGKGVEPTGFLRLRHILDTNKSTLIQRLLVLAGPGEVVCKLCFYLKSR